MKKGDLITSYHKGIHEVTKIESRDGHGDLIYYKKRYREDGTPDNSNKENCCDVAYCKPYLHLIETLEKTLKALKEIKE